jgi:hypothetical protein
MEGNIVRHGMQCIRQYVMRSLVHCLGGEGVEGLATGQQPGNAVHREHRGLLALRTKKDLNSHSQCNNV